MDFHPIWCTAVLRFISSARWVQQRTDIVQSLIVELSRECCKKQTEFFAFRRFKAAGRRIILNTLIYMSAVWGKRYCLPVAELQLAAHNKLISTIFLNLNCAIAGCTKLQSHLQFSPPVFVSFGSIDYLVIGWWWSNYAFSHMCALHAHSMFS